jgi:hypothetical protein
MRLRWKYWGKPLILVHHHSSAACTPANVMFSLVAQVARLFRFNPLETPSSPAATLMESADSRAGLDARHAQELRAAASAWLSVVR